MIGELVNDGLPTWKDDQLLDKQPSFCNFA